MEKNKKRALGQFFTKKKLWLLPQIIDFIKNSKAKIAYDPFVGNGDMLKAVKNLGFKKFIGLDIDKNLNWKYNDSLIKVPKIKNSVIITNPPYLTNYSAKRKRIYDHVSKYFEACKYDDLYQLAMEKCMNNKYGIMIVPETFINSSFPKNRLTSLTILEENPFGDTENPVCVICFNNKKKSLDKIKIYKNNILLGTLGYFEKLRLKPTNTINMKFNDIDGRVALRAVDTTNPKKLISFMKKEDLDYDLQGIKHSSRLITLINIKNVNGGLNNLLSQSNGILNQYRQTMHDILLSPFKGNRKDGKRRRRLDYATARAILEKAYNKLNQPNLFLKYDK